MSYWFMQRAGVNISVKLRSNEAAQCREPILRGLQAEPTKGRGEINLVVGGKEGAWSLIDKEANIERVLKSPGDLIYHFTDRIVFHVANNTNSHHCIHAAAVSYDGGVLIVPAKSGSGKSTFATWLVANGFDYITDELILINAEGKIEGIGRPIQIKANGLNTVKTLLKQADDYLPGNMANAVTAESLGGQMVEAGDNKLAALVFPEYSPSAEYSFTELSSANAGLELMNNHVNARNLEGHGFSAMMAMVRATPRFSLNYGGFDKLPSDFAEQLKQLCQAV